MKLDKATINDFESIIKFYDDVISRTPEMETYARWKKGQHPTEEGIKAYIEEGSTLHFTLIFNGLPKACRSFDLVELIPQAGGFEYRKINRNKSDVYHLDFN